MRHGKNNALNRALAMLLSIMMVVAMLPTGMFAAFAATEDHVDVFTFTVTENESGDPVVGAQVRLYNDVDKEWTQETGDDGVAEFSEFTSEGLEGLISGTFDYEVTADGYAESSGTVGGSDAEWVGNVDVKLTAVTPELKSVTVSVSGGNAKVELNGNETMTTTVPVGDSVAVKITPEDGSYIKNLTVGESEKIVDHGQPFEETIDVNDDTVINVTIQKEYTVSIVQTGEGTVTVSKADGSNVVDQTKVDAGEQLTLKVQPDDDGHQIDSVKIDSEERMTNGSKTSYEDSIMVSADVKIEVTFVEVFNVTVTVNGSGNASVTPDGGEKVTGGSVTVTKGTKIDVEATPDEHYRVVGVIVNGVSKDDVSRENDSSYKIEGLEVNETCEIEVTFALNIYTVTADKAENGTVTVEEPAQVEWGKDKKVYVTPEDGYTIEQITVDSDPVETVLREDGQLYFTITNIQSDKNVKVTFKEKAKAGDADLTIDTDAVLRSEEQDGSTLYVIKQGDAVTFSTDKAGIKLIDDGGLVIGGSENEKFVSISETKTIAKIQLYYKADGELYEDWHDVETVKKEVFVDTEAPTVQFTVSPEANDNGFHNADFSITITTTDGPEKVYAGIQKIEYLIKDNEQEESWIEPPLYECKDEITNTNVSTIAVKAMSHNFENVTVKVKVTDLAGNEETYEKVFHVNPTEPLITLALTGSQNVNAQTGFYTSDRQLTITVIDRWDTFDKNAVAEGLDIKANDVKVTVQPEEITWQSEVERSQTHIGTYTFSVDAHYEWSFSYTNKADKKNGTISLVNPEDTTFYDFTIDKGGPQGLAVEYETDFVDVVLGTLTFGFYKAPVKVTIKASDETAGIQQFTYSYKVQNSDVAAFTDTVNLGDDGFTVEGSESSYSFEIPAEFRGSVSFSATDKAGQTTSYEDSRIIVIDTIAPGVTVSYDNNDATNEKFYKGDRTATIEIDEANFFGTAEYGKADFNDVIAGKENAYLEITVGKTTNDGTHTDTKQYPEFTKKADGKYTATILFDEDADYTLTIQYTDRSGNEAVIGEYQKEFTVDKTAPTIEVSFDNNTAQNEKYFGADRKATITVTEHNFDAATVTAGIVCSGSPMNDFDADLQNDSSWHHDGDVHTTEITFSVDGHYTFNPACSDKAGNPNASVDYGESVAGEEFVLDKVAPKQDSLKISYSKSVLDTVLETISFGFYKAPVTVTIEAEDETSGIDYFTYTYAVSDGVSTENHGEADKVIAHSEITSSGNSASATFQIPPQFRGTVSFVATDMAGNSEDKVDDKVIVVDNIAPGITVSYDNNDARNEKYYDKDRTATITIDEANFFGDAEWDARDLYDLIPETDKEYLAISATKRLLNSSESITTKMRPEFTKEGDTYTAAIEFNENAAYTFEIEYTDRSGNVGTVAEYQKEFVINKVPPKLSISYDNTDVLNGTYYKADLVATIQIAESTFRASEVAFTISATDVTGKAIDLSSKAYETWLKDQSHWTMSEDNVWTAQITLDIEGNYELNLKYENLAGTPQEKEVTDSFCIDKSDPDNLKISYEPDFVGVLLEALTFGFYKAPVKVTLEATDDYAGVDYFVYSYKVQENASEKNAGKTDVRTVESQLTREGNKTSATFEIPAQFRGFVSFDVFDRSGNQNSFADENVVVTDNIAPAVNVTYDNNDAVYEKYYNKDRVATITIDEANFFYDDLTKDNRLVITVDKTTDAGVHTTENVMPTFSKNGDVYIGTVEFRENADYKFTIAYTDRSGNTAVIKEYQTEFTIDKTAPTIKVTYDNNNSKNGDQFKEDRTATIVITEHNFKPSDVVAKVTASGTEVTDYASYLKNADSWTTVGDVHTAEIKYTDEAHYEFSIGYSDMAGVGNASVNYEGQVAPEKFTLDKSAPTQLEITIDSKSVLGSNSIAFDTFYDKAVSVKLAANCDISGLESLKYQKVSSVPEYDVNGQWIDYNTETGIVVTPSEKFIIYFRAEDRAGNYTIVNSTGIVVDDKMPEGTDEKNAPEIDIFPDAPNANGFHNGNVNVDLHVIDPKYTGQGASATGHYSGLNKITYRIYTTDMGTDVQETGTLLELGTKTDGAVFDDDRLASSWSGSITIDATVFNSNNTIVEITAIDNAGNTRVTTTKAGDIQIDVTAPEIDVSYSNNAADSKSFFKADRTATVVVTERNFDPKDVKVTITNTDRAIPSLSEWRQTSAGTGNGDGTTWEATITYNADGDYTFEITYSDLADNLMSGVSYAEGTVAATSFTIDKTIPLIGVVYDNDSADPENNNYYKAERTATITITEHNFNADRVNITLTATDDGNATTLPTVSGWTSNGNVHTATIRYAADALYGFDIAFNDMAGNAAADFAKQTFYVDKTNPTLEITGVANNSANSGDVVPIVSYSDTNYDSSRVTITLSGANRGEIKQLDGSYADIHNGRTFTFTNFAKEEQVDDIYTLNATLTDKAGNTTTQSITFSVNRFGSTYAVSDDTKALNGSYVKTPKDAVLTETNANELSDITITLFKNNETITLKEGDDYRINVTGGESEWYQYTYTIFAKNFEDDGVYRISVHSKDAAGNVAENGLDTKNMEISFGVDKTAPTLVVTNLENGVTYALESMAAQMSANDNLLLDSISVYLDNYDTPYKTWSAEEIASILADDGEFKFDILGDSTSSHKVRIVCTDAAGNETVEEITDFFVTTNIWVRYYNNRPLFFGSIGGVILLAVLIVVIVVLKRRKKEKR